MKAKTDAEKFRDYLNKLSKGNAATVLDQTVKFSSKKKKK